VWIHFKEILLGFFFFFFWFDISREKLSSKSALLFLKEKYTFGHVKKQN